MSNIDSNKQIDTYQMGQDHVLESIWLKFHNSSQGAWIIKIREALKLCEKLKEFNPKHILELGTGIGCSTELMAFTCPETHIYTVEQNPKCIEIAKTLINEKLQERIYFKHSNVQTGKFFEVSPFQEFMLYGDEFDWQEYDFILVDGPGPILAKRTNLKTGKVWEAVAELPGGDVIHLLSLMKDGTIIYIDKRQLMVHLYSRFLSNYLELVETNNLYSIFRRNTNSIKKDLSDFKNNDLVYRSLLMDGYFNEHPKE